MHFHGESAGGANNTGAYRLAMSNSTGTASFSAETERFYTGVDDLGSVGIYGYFANATPGIARLSAQQKRANGITRAFQPSLIGISTESVDIPMHAVSVTSQHGGIHPDITAARNDTELNLFITNSPILSPDTQLYANGASAAGNEYTTVDSTNITLTVTNSVDINWNWTTNFLLNASSMDNGDVSPTSSWYTAESSAILTAIPDEYYYFNGWEGDIEPSQTSSNPVNLVASMPLNISAGFAPFVTVTNLTPHYWLASYGITNNFDANEHLTASNGLMYWQSYTAALDPHSATSVLEITAIEHTDSGEISFNTATNRLYSVHYRNIMSDEWTLLTNNIAGTGGTVTIAEGTEKPRSFYIISVTFE
jgi:hypothetical protein